MYRVSVTTLEKFRRFMADVSSFDTEESLIEAIQGIFIGNDKTRTGEGFHKLIEKDYSRVDKYYRGGDILFTHDQAQPAFAYKGHHPYMIHEVNVKKVYEVAGRSIMITGRVDGVEGIEIRDVKTKYRAIDWSEYMDSCQWKWYLDMLGLGKFHYDVFEVHGFTDLTGPAPHLLPGVRIDEAATLTLHSYPNMQKDIHAVLGGFMEYLDDRGFWHLLKPAHAENALAH